METHEKQILKYLQEGNTLSKQEALRMFSCWNSGDVIYRLRKKGFMIETTMVEKVERPNIFEFIKGERKRTVRYAEYSLIQS